MNPDPAGVEANSADADAGPNGVPALKGLDQDEKPERPQRFAVRASPEAGETTPQGANLVRHERVNLLEKDFEAAISELEAGNPTAAPRAVDALSALRFELFETPEGRAHHAELELELDAHTEKQ